ALHRLESAEAVSEDQDLWYPRRLRPERVILCDTTVASFSPKDRFPPAVEVTPSVTRAGCFTHPLAGKGPSPHRTCNREIRTPWYRYCFVLQHHSPGRNINWANRPAHSFQTPWAATYRRGGICRMAIDSRKRLDLESWMHDLRRLGGQARTL